MAAVLSGQQCRPAPLWASACVSSRHCRGQGCCMHACGTLALGAVRQGVAGQRCCFQPVAISAFVLEGWHCCATAHCKAWMTVVLHLFRASGCCDFFQGRFVMFGNATVLVKQVLHYGVAAGSLQGGWRHNNFLPCVLEVISRPLL
jgi:hypothetical protein